MWRGDTVSCRFGVVNRLSTEFRSWDSGLHIMALGALFGYSPESGSRLKCRLRWASGVVAYGVTLISYRLEVVVECSSVTVLLSGVSQYYCPECHSIIVGVSQYCYYCHSSIIRSVTVLLSECHSMVIII